MGPQSPLLFVVLLLVFGGLVFALARSRRVVLKTLAGMCAFVPPMVFGVAAVNKYYDYYASWDDVWSDLSDEAPAGSVALTDLSTPGALDHTLAAVAKHGRAGRTGFLITSPLTGARSGISRVGMVFLPPQYFQSKYAHLRFPVLELLHGGPGTPSDYTRVMKITRVYLGLLATGKARPAVLVMPDSNGGRDVALQCLDTVNGPKDETYLTDDVPGLLASRLRVQPQGTGWGISGFSEGGYCAANLGLRHPDRYGVSGVLSGYFEPLPLSRLPRRADPFARNKGLREANTPSLKLRNLPGDSHLPKFWVMAGSGSKRDLLGAQNFVTQLHRFQPTASTIVIKGGRHDYQAWRKAEPMFLQWATPLLTPPIP